MNSAENKVFAVPSPKEILGFQPGEDRNLASWDQITGYFGKLCENAQCIKWFDMGKSTEGRPFYYLCISSPDTLSNLEDYLKIQRRLSDPRGISDEEADDLLTKGKTIVMISCSIHATEVGAAQMSMELAYQLERGYRLKEAKITEILDNVVLLLVPSLNPDGLDLVVDWYKKTLGTSYEGTTPPFLYQKYAGHDNNRDWFMLNLTENRLAVEKLHNVWHPQIVYDLHQMGDAGFRLFVPPYLDPYEPNVDFILRQEIAELGLHMMGALLSDDKSGACCYTGYDAFAPSRAYQHYHGGVRILSEAASARLATPVTRKKADLRIGRDGSDPKEATWNHPLPWPGGEWRLSDIVDYELILCKACLEHAAKHRKMWLWNFYQLGKRACQRKEPFAYILSAQQKDPVMLYRLLKVLADGQVEIHEAKERFNLDGASFPKGSYVIKLAQPCGGYAKTLLEVQHYPDLRQYPGGPPKLPYDVTGHTLPLLMGVKTYLAKEPFEAALTKLETLPEQKDFFRGLLGEAPCNPPKSQREGGGVFVLSPHNTNSFRAVNHLLAEGAVVYRTTIGFNDGQNYVAPGSFIIEEASIRQKEGFSGMCRDLGVLVKWTEAVLSPKLRLGPPKVGVYKSYRPIADEGWLRYALEEFGFPYDSVTNQVIRGGGLRRKVDTILFPSQPKELIQNGNPENSYPREYCGGLGQEGKEALGEFLEDGGTLIFMDASAQWAVTEFGLPCFNVLSERKPSDFFAPGSILRVMVNDGHPLGFGMPRETKVMFMRSPAWAVAGDISASTFVPFSGSHVSNAPSGASGETSVLNSFGPGGMPEGHVVARHPGQGNLLSGWLLGERFLALKAALVSFSVGKGRVILVGFHPYFRGQAKGTYKFIFNGIYLGSSEPV